MIKVLCAAIGLTAVLGMADVTMAHDGNLNQSIMKNFGLSSVQVMTDVQGDQIRGKGFVLVFGKAWAGGNADGYFRIRPHVAAGSKSVSSNGASAGGSSFAIAF